VTALTSLDAISHALETYVTKRRNAISLMFSREAWRRLSVNFGHVLAEPKDLAARGEMQLGACFAGLAIEHSMLGAAHALANPLTANFGIVHGEAIALMLPHVVRFNGETRRDWYCELLAYVSGTNGAPAVSSGPGGLAEFLAQMADRDGGDDVDAARRFIAAARDNQARLVDEINVQVMLESQALFEVQGRKALVEGRINSMARSSDGVAMLLADLQKRQQDWMPGRYLITNPLPGYRIGSSFGMRFHPILNIERLHAGGDMGAPSGTPIHAAADGTVVVASERGGYGLAVVIDHGDSLATLYAHQSALAVSAGDVVKRGDVIGWVGSTGLSTGPHLHLETRIKGMPVNPEGIVDFEADVDYGPN